MDLAPENVNERAGNGSFTPWSTKKILPGPGATCLMPQTHKELQDEEDAEYVSEYYRLMMEGKVFCLKTRPLLVA